MASYFTLSLGTLAHHAETDASEVQFEQEFETALEDLGVEAPEESVAEESIDPSLSFPNQGKPRCILSNKIRLT